MKNLSTSSLLTAFLLMLGLTSCDLVVGIFEAGAITAIIVVALVIALFVWIIRKFLG